MSSRRRIPLVLAVLSVLLALGLIWRPRSGRDMAQGQEQAETGRADGQRSQPVNGARGDDFRGRPEDIEVLTMGVGPNVDILVIIDKAKRSMCLYHYQGVRAPHEGLALLAARQFGYDLELTDFNNAAPGPEAIRRIVEAAGAADPNGSP